MTQQDDALRILVVGSEAVQAGTAARELADIAPGWELARMDPAEAASASGLAADVVVCAAHAGDFNALAFLARLRADMPDAMRILLVDEDSGDDVLAALEVSHRVLPGPLDALALVEAIEGVTALQALLEDPALKQAIARVGNLPAAPRQYFALTELLRDPDSSVVRIAEVVSQDPTSAARVLRLSNSAYYSGGREISDLRTAIIRLGRNTLRRLVLASEVFSAGPESEALRDRALRTSRLARELLAGSSAELAGTAGLLAEVGLLLPPLDTGDAPYSTTGAYLLGLWGLPAPIVEAVAFHDRPALSGGSFWVTGAVHVAAALVNGREVDEAYLRSVGQLDRLPRWRAMAEVAANDD